ncbi:MAG: type II secretion system F family protein [Candidatus Nanopusillus sp.]
MREEIVTILIIIILIFLLYSIFNFSILNSIVTGIVIGIFPYLIYQTTVNNIEKEKEEQFIRFSVDLIELLKSGLSLPIALKQLEKNDYGRINELVKNLSSRIDWGISIEDSFDQFAEESNNRMIKRTIQSLIDIYKEGGNLEQGLEAIINSIMEIRKIKEDKKVAMHENIIHSYIVFVFFLGIIFTFQIFLLPFLQISLPGQSSKIDFGFINDLMYYMSIIQAVFAGLSMGKMYDGSYKAGAKYIAIFLFMVTILFNIIIPIVPKGMFLININM